MRQMQDATGLARFAADLMRAECGLPLSEDHEARVLAEYEQHEADVASEGHGMLLAQAVAAEIAVVDHRALRAVREALAETEQRYFVAERSVA